MGLCWIIKQSRIVYGCTMSVVQSNHSNDTCAFEYFFFKGYNLLCFFKSTENHPSYNTANYCFTFYNNKATRLKRNCLHHSEMAFSWPQFSSQHLNEASSLTSGFELLCDPYGKYIICLCEMHCNTVLWSQWCSG